MPDGGSHGQQALPDPGVDAVRAASAVLFERQLALEGVEDRFDPLAHAQQPLLDRLGGTVADASTRRADQVHPQLVEEGLELGSGESLVRQDDLSAGDQGMVE